MSKISIITYKIEYKCNENLYEIIKQYNNVLHFTYNRFKDNNFKLSTKDITKLQKSLNNINYMNSHLLNSSIYDSKTYKDKEKVIFGSRKLFLKRCKNKIDKEEFNKKKLLPLASIGEKNKNGNRLFQIININNILFKLDKKHHYNLELINVGKKRSKELEKLISLQNNKILPITYKLDFNYIYISFDYSFIKEYNYQVKKNRVISIDINPNYIGYSIIDWKSETKYHIIEVGSYSLKSLNDYENSLKVSSDSKEKEYIKNKRNHEVIHIVYELFKLCKHYKCQIFSIEDLNIKSKDNKRGRKFNRLVNNQWNRNLLINMIKKLIDCSSTQLIEVVPNYSSFIGNLVYRNKKLPDYILSSIEIGRRGYEFYNQYISKKKEIKKNIIFPDLKLIKNSILISLEEIKYECNFKSWNLLYKNIKNSKLRYRVSLDDYNLKFFSKFYKQRYVNKYIFYTNIIYNC